MKKTMRDGIRAMVFRYLAEAVNNGSKEVDDLHAMSENFVKDLDRFLAARKDFKEERI